MGKKVMVTVRLLVDVEEWMLAYGVAESAVADEVMETIAEYKRSDSAFAGASDAPMKVHGVTKARIVSTY